MTKKKMKMMMIVHHSQLRTYELHHGTSVAVHVFVVPVRLFGVGWNVYIYFRYDNPPWQILTHESIVDLFQGKSLDSLAIELVYSPIEFVDNHISYNRLHHILQRIAHPESVSNILRNTLQTELISISFPYSDCWIFGFVFAAIYLLFLLLVFVVVDVVVHSRRNSSGKRRSIYPQQWRWKKQKSNAVT